MARGINKVILIGNLGADPETRAMPSGTTVANLRIATSESWRDKQTGEQQERTEWHRVALFGRLAEIAAEYLKKGSQVYIEGSLRTRKWQDKQGNDRYSTEIIGNELQMLGGRGGGGGAATRYRSGAFLRGRARAVAGGGGARTSGVAQRGIRRRHPVLKGRPTRPLVNTQPSVAHRASRSARPTRLIACPTSCRAGALASGGCICAFIISGKRARRARRARRGLLSVRLLAFQAHEKIDVFHISV